jgi:lipopolysaccharide transport system permease protein
MKPEPLVVITPPRGWRSLGLGELWDYRELLAVLAWRDVSVRYKQSIVGVGWVLVQPLASALLFTIIFGHFAKLPSDGIPYAVFSYCALLPWNYFSRTFSDTSGSLVGASHLVSKVYFPRLILPLSRVVAGLVDFAVSLVVLALLMAWYGVRPGWGVLLLPLLLALAGATALGVGLWLTALNVRYRDIGFIVPFAAQLWMFATPVAYSAGIVPERWRALYGLNPMVGVVEGFRWALLGATAPRATDLAFSAGIVLVLLVGGLFYFRRAEQSVADHL